MAVAVGDLTAVGKECKSRDLWQCSGVVKLEGKGSKWEQFVHNHLLLLLQHITGKQRGVNRLLFRTSVLVLAHDNWCPNQLKNSIFIFNLFQHFLCIQFKF